jgi:hypothetical protein
VPSRLGRKVKENFPCSRTARFGAEPSVYSRYFLGVCVQTVTRSRCRRRGGGACERRTGRTSFPPRIWRLGSASTGAHSSCPPMLEDMCVCVDCLVWVAARSGSSEKSAETSEVRVGTYFDHCPVTELRESRSSGLSNASFRVESPKRWDVLLDSTEIRLRLNTLCVLVLSDTAKRQVQVVRRRPRAY